MKNIIKKFNIVILLFTIMFLTGCHPKPHSQKEIKDYVAKNVPEDVELIDQYVDSNAHGSDTYVYVFKSKERDLQFYAYSSVPGGSMTGYEMSEYYNLALQDYYMERMKPVLSECTNSGVYINPDDRWVSNYLYVNDESDAKYVASYLAECNEKVFEEFKYKPGADLTDKNVLGITFYIYPSVGADDRIGLYTLNGKDGADTISKELIKMLDNIE